MQYGVEIFPYQRIKKIDKGSKEPKLSKVKDYFMLLTYFLASLLISRVLLINLMAPFGIAFLLAIISTESRKIQMISAIGAILGYMTLYNNISYIPAYFLSIVAVTIISGFSGILKKQKLIFMFLSIFVIFSLYKLFISKTNISMSFISSFFETACIFPLYFIIDFSIICFKELKTRHLYNSEEIISMAITLSLLIAGSWGATIYNVSIRNVIAIAFVIILGYIKGSASGAACGVAIGTIIGVTSNDMISFIGVYGLCGMISGVFKETGKWISGISFMISFSIVKMYSDVGVNFKIIEALISLLIFYAIPERIYYRLEIELDWQKKQELMKENYVDKIKAIFVDKLDSFSSVLSNMATVIEKLVDNDKLTLKNKSAALIENLGDRVCSNCNMNTMCWKREAYYTYNAFGELIQNFQEKKLEVPFEIERKCIKRSALLKHTEEISNNYIINEMWRKRLSECRELLAGQINSMADSVSEIVDEFNYNIRFNGDVENDIRRIFNKQKITFKDVFCYNNKDSRLIIKLTMEACGGKQKCIKNVLPLINEVTGKCMCINTEGCDINSGTKCCSVTVEETPRYHVAACVSKACKEGEKSNGDSYSYGKLNDGTYMAVISDGMGSGAQAGQESSAAVELIEKFADAGFNKLTAINTVNSIMTIKFSEDEKFSTVDLSSVDLYEGQVEFMKVGAVASFIKRGKNVEVIKSKTLPIGVLDKADIDIIKKKVQSGDMIIMISDGVTDYENASAGKVDWIVEFLKESNYNTPEELSKRIIEKAKELSGGKVKDDMTVVVEKVYSLY